MTRLSRRALLAAAGAGVAGLAGCGSTDAETTEDGGTDPTETATTTGTATMTESMDTATATPTTTTPATTERTWYTAELTNAKTGETFTVADLNADGPVLLETFAIWCSRCQRQQEELKTFHEQAPSDVTTVALNVDPNEDREQVATHAEENGFDWRYAVAPSAVTESLIAQFDRSITVPPRVPMVRICPGGDATRLAGGHKPTDDLLSTLDACE